MTSKEQSDTIEDLRAAITVMSKVASCGVDTGPRLWFELGQASGVLTLRINKIQSMATRTLLPGEEESD